MTILDVFNNIAQNGILLFLSTAILILAGTTGAYLFLPLLRLRKLISVATDAIKKDIDPAPKPEDRITQARENISRHIRMYMSKSLGMPILSMRLEEFVTDWNANKLTLFNDQNVSIVSPADYFTQDNLLPIGFSRRFMRAIPGVLTTTGIFGTFLGLSKGLLELSLRLDPGTGAPNPQKISQGILAFMGDMSTAFITSVLGIGLALIWIGYERKVARHIDQQLYELTSRLSRLFPCLGPNNVWRYSLQYSAEQANSLKSLAGNMAQDISGGINDAINEHIKPQTDTMLRIVEKMADFTGKNQIEGMEKLLERFGDLVGERLKNQFDNLAETIEEICNWQRSSKDSLDLILTQIQQVTEQQNTMLVNASRAAELFQESLGELGHMHQSLSAATSHFESLLGNLKTHSEWAKDINAEISRTVENFTHLSRENALQTSQQLDHLKDATATSLEQVEVLNTHLSQTVRQQVDHMQEIFNASTQQVQTLNGHLQTSMEKFVSDCREGLGLTFTDFDKHLASLTHALSGTVAETDETVQELLGKMEELRSVTSAMVESQSQFKDTATDVIDHHTLLFGELRELTENLQKVNAQNGGTTLPENAE